MGKHSLDDLMISRINSLFKNGSHAKIKSNTELAELLHSIYADYEYSTYSKYIRDFLKDGRLIKNKSSKPVFSLMVKKSESYIANYPLLQLTPSLSFTLFDSVQSVSLKVSHNTASSVATLINTMYNSQNICATSIGDFIICYEMSNSTDKEKLPFTERIRNIISGMGLQETTDTDSNPPVYYDSENEAEFVYNDLTKQWQPLTDPCLFPEPPAEPIYGGILSERNRPKK